MRFFYSLKKKYLLNGNFPRTAIFIIDELESLFLHRKDEEVIFLFNNTFLMNEIVNSISLLQNQKYIDEAKRKVNNDGVYRSVFFDCDGSPIIKEIKKYFSKTIVPPSLSDIFINLVDKIKLKEDFKGLNGYELLALFAFYYMNMAFKITNRAHVNKLTGRSLNSLDKKINANLLEATELCLKASEAVFLAKEILFTHKKKNIIETAKLLIDKVKSRTENELKVVCKLALIENARKGGQARHSETKKIKEQILIEYKEMLINAKNSNLPPKSKTQFAKQMAIKYKQNEQTIRSNWLKGYNPELS
ncbi:hypothetical protein ACLSZP_04685 [Avibacterium avium]|uniref:hypothetical protein n=1 Tax=Avibacterium avium TaxID=751 RepID=UPI003BF8AC5A